MDQPARPASKAEFAVLFVCMGNICRSPTAHGVFLHKARQRGVLDRLRVDSAGTHSFHNGSPPDPRSQRHAHARGYDLSTLRARQIEAQDFPGHDLILVMDWDNQHLTEDQCPALHRRKIRRMTEFCRSRRAEVVPDPYYAGAEGFEEVLDLVEDACEGLLDHIEARLSQRGTR